MDEQARDALLPCPFCGGKAHLHDAAKNPAGESWVSCQSCQASSILRSNEQAAISAWNTRKAREASQTPSASLREAETAYQAQPFRGDAYHAGFLDGHQTALSTLPTMKEEEIADLIHQWDTENRTGYAKYGITTHHALGLARALIAKLPHIVGEA